MPDDTAMFLLTDPSAAGKSTVARLLAGHFPQGVHVEGDAFRRSVVAGREEMTPEPSQEALTQQSPEQTVDEILRLTAFL